MEYAPRVPMGEGRTPEAPKVPRSVERGGFVERVRKNKKRQASGPEAATEKRKKQPEATASPEVAPENAHRMRSRKFGEGILHLFKQRSEVTPPVVTPPVEQAQAASGEAATTPEDQPLYERASKMRRFARTIIHRVRKEVSEEPMRAQREELDAKPINTEPLKEAAEELREAADDLSETMREVSADVPSSAKAEQSRDDTTGETAKTDQMPEASAVARSESHGDNGYDSQELTAEYESDARPTVVERISARLREHEQQAEVDKATTLAALMLGAIAVVVAGHEFGARRRLQRKHKGLSRFVHRQEKTIESQQKQIDQQKQETDYAELRRLKADEMSRRERSSYYKQLSTLAHRQTEATREVAEELQHQAAPRRVAIAEVQPVIAAFEKSRAISRRNERVEHSAGHAPEVKSTPERRVATKAKPAITSQSGGSGVAEGVTWTQKIDTKAPLSPVAQRELAVRKARIDRIGNEAWLYGAGLALAAAGVIVAIIFN